MNKSSSFYECTKNPREGKDRFVVVVVICFLYGYNCNSIGYNTRRSYMCMPSCLQMDKNWAYFFSRLAGGFELLCIYEVCASRLSIQLRLCCRVTSISGNSSGMLSRKLSSPSKRSNDCSNTNSSFLNSGLIAKPRGRRDMTNTSIIVYSKDVGGFG